MKPPDIKQGVSPRSVDCQTLQKKPTTPGAALPGVMPAKAKYHLSLNTQKLKREVKDVSVIGNNIKPIVNTNNRGG